jgi:uncharacterized protein (TIGR02117 family)
LIARWLLRPLGAVAGTLLLYWCAAAVGMMVPVGPSEPSRGTIPVHVASNGIHVDLVLPADNHLVDWRREGVTAGPETRYLAFSWGEEDFFLATPSWEDFRLDLGIGALLWQTDVLVHVTEMRAAPRRGQTLLLTDSQYQRLAGYILESMGGRPRPAAPGYAAGDRFYAATGVYSPFMTCNQWANQALRAAGRRAALWSPLPLGVVAQAR